MMVYQDSAQLNFPKEKTVSCHADHSQMAKLRRGESGAYPDIKRAIKQALLRVGEDQANAGLSRLQLPSGGKAVVEEQWRQNGDDINEPRSQQPPFPAENSHPNDAQSPGSSSPEPQGKTIDVLHERDIVLTPSPLVSDRHKNGVIRQDSEILSDSTIIPPSTLNMSRDGGETPKGDAEAPEVTMRRATDALSDRRSAPSSPMEKTSPEQAIDSVEGPISRLDLCSAAREGDVEKVRSLLAQGCSIHESSEDLVDPDKDAFLLAAESGRLDVLKLLLEHNCDFSKRSLSGSTALHLIRFDPEIKPKAVIKSLVILLLEHGVPLEARISDGHTALISSASIGKISIAECLLEHGADIHSTDNFGYTALHWAAQEGHHEIVALLISKGADIHSTDNYGYTALHRAVRKGHHEAAALLISKGADIHSTDKFGYTALHRAAQKGHHEAVALLISKGANLETRTKGHSQTPLHESCSAKNGSGESAKLLLKAGADKEATSGNPSCRPLHIAAGKGNLEAVNELLAFEVEIDAADDDGWRALHFASASGQWRIIEALLAKGANPLLKNKNSSLASLLICIMDDKISQEDREKCKKLLDDAEKAWREKQKQEKEKRRQERKERGDGRFSRFIARLND